MDDYIRKGIESDILTKALGKVEGQVLITPTLQKKIEGAVKERSVMRSLASIQTISTGALDVVVEDGKFVAGWVDEEDAREDTATPKLTTLKIPVHELYAQPKATQKLMDDSAINIEDWLVGRLADSFAQSENEAFITGNGEKKPLGLLTNDKIKVLESKEKAPTVQFLLSMINELPEEFLAGATFLMNRTTMALIQSLCDQTGRFIWQQSLSDPLKQTIFGVPVVCTPHMPAIKKDALAIVLGDIKTAYKIVDRTDIKLMRDPYTEKPFVKFYATRRVGGAVVVPNAVKIAKFVEE
jgi:HK97 family phage major capsid protein